LLELSIESLAEELAGIQPQVLGALKLAHKLEQ
jgi:hypothetical protein